MKRNGENRACAVCGKDFYVTPSDVAARPCRTCSAECSSIARRKERFVTCEMCGTPFRPPRRTSRFCSDRCARAHTRKGKLRGRLVACEVCGKEAWEHPSRPRRFCSRACAQILLPQARKGVTWSADVRARMSAGQKKRDNSKHRKPPTPLVCTNCGETWYLPGRLAQHANKRKFCGRACFLAYAKAHPEWSGRFLGGPWPHYGPNWPAQRRAARERDGNACQDCGQQGSRLPVHHIRPRRDFLDDYVAANDLDNLVTLCRPCHQRRENKLMWQRRNRVAKRAP